MAQKQLSMVHDHFRDVKLFKEQELGHGSFATVCQAQCDDLLCAAKVLHAEFFNQQYPDPNVQTFIEKFIEECRILPSITHPNIVQCFGTYQDPDTDLPVLLMELMDESLTNYIERFRDPLPYHIEVSFSYDVALGLSYLHSRGYVHRDLSSNNVLIMAGVRAKITDFGMCRAMTGSSNRQTKKYKLTLCPGTHPFMPPEALIDPPTYTDKLDIFSLGAVMIQIMSRQYPKPELADRLHMSLEAIPEEERRSNHIKLICQGHQMLPLVKQCIQNSYDERPSSHDVCNTLKSLKESQDYQQSKDQESVEQNLEKASQLHEAECQRLQIRHQEEIARIKVEHKAECQRLQANHQEDIARITEQNTKDIQMQIANIHHHYHQQLRQLQHPTPPLPTCAQHFQAPVLPSHGQIPQQQQSAQVQLPVVQGYRSVKHNVPDTTTIAGSPVAKSALFDPLNLPEVAFDTHDFEMFHQEVHKPEDFCGHVGILINPRSDNFGDFSSFNLDDHLAYCSHMELSESSAGSEEKSKSEQQGCEEESEYNDDVCTSGIQFGTISVQRVKDVKYELVDFQKDSQSSGGLIHSGQDTSFDSQPPTIYSQGTQQTTPPVARPRSHSGGEKKLKQRNDSNLPSNTSTDTERPHPPIPRPRYDNNLLSTKGPPNSPVCKPVTVPRKTSPCNNKSSSALSDIQTANKDISAEDKNAATAVCTSQPLPEIHESLAANDGATTSHITSVDSDSSDSIHSEALNSLELGSPHPSLESKPSMNDMPDPFLSMPPEKPQSAYYGERLVFKERNVGDYVDISVKESSASLETTPGVREQAGASSTEIASDKSQNPNKERDVYTANPTFTDIQNAKPCRYCTNLTSDEICDVCGNRQRGGIV